MRMRGRECLFRGHNFLNFLSKPPLPVLPQIRLPKVRKFKLVCVGFGGRASHVLGEGGRYIVPMSLREAGGVGL